MDIQAYKQRLRLSAHYKEFYAETISNFMDLVASNPKGAKEFATQIAVAKVDLQKPFEVDNVEFNNQDSTSNAKTRLDAEALALIDINFAKLYKENALITQTKQLGSLKAMLKAPSTDITPAYITGYDGGSDVVETAEGDSQKSRHYVAFRTAPNFMAYPREKQEDKLRKVLTKSIAEQIAKLNLDYMVKVSKATYDSITNEILDNNLPQLFEREDALSQFSSIVSGLANNNLKASAQSTIAKYKSHSQQPMMLDAIERKVVNQVLTIQSDIEKIISATLDSASENPDEYAKARGATAVLNVWHKKFDHKGVKFLTDTRKNFGDQINNYAKTQVQSLFAELTKSTTKTTENEK